jgi:predicted O-linked N-acetylglucosamine transferase (SPINDLY family)
MATPPSPLDLATQDLHAGRLEAARAGFEKVIAADTRNARAIHCLGVIHSREDQPKQAIDFMRQAIALDPSVAEYHGVLGNTLVSQQDFSAAADAYREAVKLDPANPQGYTCLAFVLARLRRFAEAAPVYQRLLELRPSDAQAQNDLGIALWQIGSADGAIASFRRAIELKPGFISPLENLVSALQLLGRYEDACSVCRQVLATDPANAILHQQLGNALAAMGNDEEAVRVFRECIRLRPELADAHNTMGNALHHMGKLDEAAEAIHRAIAIAPSVAIYHNNLGNVFKDSADPDHATESYARAVALAPANAVIHSNALYSLSFEPAYDSAALLQEAKIWNAQHGAPLDGEIKLHANAKTTNRRLRIGYVSPDFRWHAVGRYLVPALQFHDRNEFEIHCYSDVKSPDSLTRRMQSWADVWRNVVTLNDGQLTEMIRQDQIDILVDLTLHMAGNRMLVFARKPAPVQVTWLGYPGTTGLETMDYRLTDPYLDPPGEGDALYAEKSIRLPHTFWCMNPEAEEFAQPEVNELPALQNGQITFGCFNNFCKINRSLLELWSRVLDAVPGSRMLLLAPSGSRREWVSQLLGNRVDFVSRESRLNYLKFHNRIDIGLDTLPYNGHTTSIDSLWMGVPVVTLIGQTVAGRAGFSQLSNVELSELAATTPEQFITIAANLAADLPRLAQLRRTLRERTRSSPLMDGERFARDIESAYRAMWLSYCQ